MSSLNSMPKTYHSGFELLFSRTFHFTDLSRIGHETNLLIFITMVNRKNIATYLIILVNLSPLPTAHVFAVARLVTVETLLASSLKRNHSRSHSYSKMSFEVRDEQFFLILVANLMLNLNWSSQLLRSKITVVCPMLCWILRITYSIFDTWEFGRNRTIQFV